MLELKQIASFYPENLRHYKRNILREYLQYKILSALFTHPAGAKLIFMGGTAIHIAHGSSRFSEDLDFDNRGLSRDDFRQLIQTTSRALRLEGLNVETGFTFRGAFSADIKIMNVLFDAELSKHKEERLLIKIDTQPQDFDYRAEKILLNKFDVFCRIAVVPADLLLAQKLYAILNRKRAVGRDFFDAIFLGGLTKPDFRYLTLKAGIESAATLKSALHKKCESLDLKQLARDAKPLVFAAGETKKIELFKEWVSGL